MRHRRPSFLFCSWLVSLGFQLEAHQIPDIPVRSAFAADGACVIQVEVDPRCFEADPEKAPYLLQEQFAKADEAQKAVLTGKAAAFVTTMLDFFFEPMGHIKPEFSFDFTTNDNLPLTKAGDPVVITGTWRTHLPAGATAYRIRATEACKLAVVFLNTLGGTPVERVAVLFPGETSYALDLSGRNATLASAPPEITATPSAATLTGWARWGLTALALTAAVSLLRLAQRRGWV